MGTDVINEKLVLEQERVVTTLSSVPQQPRTSLEAIPSP